MQKSVMEQIFEAINKENEREGLYDHSRKKVVVESKSEFDADNIKALIAVLGGAAFLRGMFSDSRKKSQIEPIITGLGGTALLSILEDMFKK
jgi:phosphoribosylcarboxyaminoimidazole (NCAIR) mutase